MIYITIDGDDIGNQLAQAFLNNDENRLVEIDLLLQKNVKHLGKVLAAMDYQIVACGADGITCKKEEVNYDELLQTIREHVKPFTFSGGVGKDLRDAFTALKYAKSKQKNKLCLFFENQFELVS